MIRRSLAGAVALAGLAPGSVRRCAAQSMRILSASRPLATERALDVTVDFTGGTLILLPAPAGELYNVRLRYDADHYLPVQQYDARNRTLRIGVASNGAIGFTVDTRQPQQTARVELAPSVPMQLRVNLSASDGTLELGGMSLESLTVTSGATHGTVDFADSTGGRCEFATFSVGTSQLDVQHLANAGCDAITVDGGAGAVSLDFGGTWRRDATLSVDLAMGGLTLVLPRGTGLRITGDRFLAPLADKGMVRAGDAWITPGYEHASHKIDATVKAQVVSIAVDWQ